MRRTLRPQEVYPVIAIGERCCWENETQAARFHGTSGAQIIRSIADGRLVANRQWVYATLPILAWLVRHPGTPLTWQAYRGICGEPEVN